MPFWTKRALRNLDSVLDRIAQDDPSAAERIAEVIQKASERLDDFNQMGKPGIMEETRELVLPKLPYVLVYRLAGRVEILRLLHTRRQWP